MSKYLIRKAAFHYSDENYYHHTWGVVVENKLFDDYKIAYDYLLELEREEYLKSDVGDFVNFHSTYHGRDYEKTVLFKKYMKEQFGDNFFKVFDNENFYVERDTFLPKSLTIEQVEKIRHLSGLEFYKIVSFNEEPTFYGIWGKTPYYSEDFFVCTLGDSQYFYNSYFEAFQAAISTVPDFLDTIKIKGTLEKISDTPLILKSFINLSTNIIYDEEKSAIKFSYLSSNDWTALCTLLKKKPFEIRTLTFDEVKDFNHKDYTLR